MTENIIIPWNQVWAAAVAAQRVNEKYIKRPNSAQRLYIWGPVKQSTHPDDKKLTNVALMRIFLKLDKSPITPEDIVEGEKIRNYFCGLINLVFSDEAGRFIKLAIQAAAKTEIPINDVVMPLIASLPMMYYERMKQEETTRILENLIPNSIPLDQLQKENSQNYEKNSSIKIVAQGKDQYGIDRVVSNIFATVSDSYQRYSLVSFPGEADEWKIGQTYRVTLSKNLYYQSYGPITYFNGLRKEL